MDKELQQELKDMDEENQSPKSDPRVMQCELCKSTDIETQMDVGWDIDPEGEERQHLDKCKKCGATRLWADRIAYTPTRFFPFRWVEKWEKKNAFGGYNFGPEGW